MLNPAAATTVSGLLNNLRFTEKRDARPAGRSHLHGERRLENVFEQIALKHGGWRPDAKALSFLQQDDLVRIFSGEIQIVGDHQNTVAIHRRKLPQRFEQVDLRADVEVSCLPNDLPEFLELDLSPMGLNDTKFLADIPLPPGVSIPELTQRNAPVVSIHAPRAEEPEPVAAEAAAAVPAEGVAPAAGAPGAPGVAGAAPAAAGAPGAPAAAADAKKGEEKKPASVSTPRRKAG